MVEKCRAFVKSFDNIPVQDMHTDYKILPEDVHPDLLEDRKQFEFERIYRHRGLNNCIGNPWTGPGGPPVYLADNVDNLTQWISDNCKSSETDEAKSEKLSASSSLFRDKLRRE